jgi:hypothetical protein
MIPSAAGMFQSLLLVRMLRHRTYDAALRRGGFWRTSKPRRLRDKAAAWPPHSK